MVVDDDPDIREIARLFLERDGLTVLEATDGTSALDQYFSLDPPRRPTVVVLDYCMPGLTGLQVAEQMLARFPDQVVLLFSANLDSLSRDAAAQAGVALCVAKQDAGRLPQIVRRLISPS